MDQKTCHKPGHVGGHVILQPGLAQPGRRSLAGTPVRLACLLGGLGLALAAASPEAGTAPVCPINMLMGEGAGF